MMKALLFCFFTFALSTYVCADQLQLISGKNVEGRIISQDDKSIIFDTGIGTPLTYYRDEIVNITVSPFADPASKADKLENEAVELIDAGKREEGLNKLLQAINLDPSPLRRMNYGSILFGDGVEIFKKGNLEKGKDILRICEDQLNKAIKDFNVKTEPAYVSQSYFLLGEMYANAFGDVVRAKDYYKQAVDLFDHPAAKAALEKMTTL